MPAGSVDPGAKAAPPDPMTPRILPVRRRIRETGDVVTIEIADEARAGFRPGQFNMLYAFGVGEVAISISGDAEAPGRIVHTIRSVGAASAALTALKAGDRLGVRGPFGGGWPVDEAAGRDVVILAGGIGLVPLRPAIYHLLRHRARYGRIALLYGARAPEDMLYRKELEVWRRMPDFQLRVALNRAGRDWTGDVGHVTGLLPKIRFDKADTIAMICGPEVMIRASARALDDMGVRAGQIFVSMERNMKCALGFCGHCQFGGHFICKDGPVYRYDRIRDLMAIREL